MEKSPGFYSYIAKKTRDLLYEHHNNSLELSPYVTGYAFTSAFKNGVFMSTFSQQHRHGVNFKVKLSEDPREDPQFSTTFIVDQSYIFPGLKAIFSGDGLKPHMMGLRYLNAWAGININITWLTTGPALNFSGLVRDKATSLGTSVSFDTITGLTTCSGVVSFCYKDLIASLTLNQKGNTLNASFYHQVSNKFSKDMNIIQCALSSLSVTAVGAEATHEFSTNESVITFGTQFALSHGATLKARVNNIGMASAVFKSKWNQKTFVTVSGEVDNFTEDMTPKFGIAFSTKS